MPKTIDVDPEMLEKAAGEIERLTGEYEDQYSLLYKEVDSLGTQWKGEDNVAFTASVDSFKDDFTKMSTLMRDYADYLRKSAQTYRETRRERKEAADRMHH